MKLKFYIRRAVVGLISIPFVAGAWCFTYLALIVLGGEPQQTIDETFDNGLTIGWILAVMFTFAPQVSKLMNRITGENQ